MRDLYDIYGNVVAEGGVDDDRIVAYWDLVCANPRLAAARVLGTRQASPALIAVTLDASDMDEGLLCTAARNPSTPLDRVLEWMWGGHGERVAAAAAQNPALGERTVALYDQLPRSVAEHLLANPSTPPELISRHWRAAPTKALTNPNCAPAIIDECCADGANVALLAAALQNPAVHDGYLEAAVDHQDEFVRVVSARHPRRSLEDLYRIDVAELGRSLTSERVLSTVRMARARLMRRNDPYTAQVTRLHNLRYEPLIADALLADTDTAAASRRLIAAGFDGTVAELLTIADTFEN